MAELPPSASGPMLRRSAIAAAAIVLLSAGIVSGVGLKGAADLGERIPTIAFDPPTVRYADAGAPRTIMIVGSDARRGGDRGDRRADTIILARLDRDRGSISLMSIPRDLRVAIPGHGTAKINAAYAAGGTNLTHKTVTRLLSTPGRPFEVNHVVEVDFTGFRRFVDFLGGVYIDVDQRYFNDRGGSCEECFATIDIQPGYQRLNGTKALDYVRFRHYDSDLVRAARQQDFLRQLKSQPAMRKRLKLGAGGDLVDLASHYVHTDASFRDTQQILSLIKLALHTAGKPVKEVAFGAGKLESVGADFVASPEAIDQTVDAFLHDAKPAPTGGKRRRGARRARSTAFHIGDVPGLELATHQGEDQAIVGQPHVDFPFYFPARRRARSRYASLTPRTYSLRDEAGRRHRAYRLVLETGLAGENYGVQAMTWRNPPTLAGRHSTVRVKGRRLSVYADGAKVRLVAWRTKSALYYVHNTLTRTLTKPQMIAIAASLKSL